MDLDTFAKYQNRDILFSFTSKGIQIFDNRKKQEKDFISGESIQLIRFSKPWYPSTRRSSNYNRSVNQVMYYDLTLRIFTIDGQKKVFRTFLSTKNEEKSREMAGSIESYAKDMWGTPEIKNPYHNIFE